MFNQTWYRLLAWVLASFYFFVMAAAVITIFQPGPTESQAAQWMHQMMAAMHSSLMGWTSENHHFLNQLLADTSKMVGPAAALGAVIGIIIKLRRLQDEQ